MFDFHDIATRLRQIIAQQENREKIRDKDIAHALNLDPQYYAVIKRRNKVPHEAIALFCKKHRLSLNWLLFRQKPKYLE